MKIKVKIKEYADRFEVETPHGGFIAEKPISRDEVRRRAKLWVEGLKPQPPETPISEEEVEVDV